MKFEFKWLNWEPGQNSNNVSNVSESPIHVQKPVFCPKPLIPEKEEEKMRLIRYAAGGPKKSLDAYTRVTDTTDINESDIRILDGHQVARIVWENEKAIDFTDDQGRFWRYLYAAGKSWPVVVEGQK